MQLSASDKNLIELGWLLKEASYSFTTITPASHKRVLRRDQDNATHASKENSLRDLFGWSKNVLIDYIPQRIFDLLSASEAIEVDGETAKSRVRFSTIDNMLFMHSAFPTRDEDSVFLGPDSYRFMRFLKEKVTSAKVIIDIGCGSGVGGLCLANHLRKKGISPKVILTDINERALNFSNINIHINKVSDAELIKSDILKKCPKGADTIIANPPFVIDESGRKYRDGGNSYGAELSAEILKQALAYLGDLGQIAIYTGASIVNGEDQFLKLIKPNLSGREFDYSEIDPDIFGELLNSAAYSDVERTAAVGLFLQM